MTIAGKARILIVAHGHPEISPGGAETAAYNLFQALRDDPSVEASFLAWSGHPAYNRAGTPFSSFRGRSDETILNCPSQTFDYFLFSQALRYVENLIDYLKAVDPDVVHIHHYSHVGLEFIAAARKARPDIRIVLTLHEYLGMCPSQGQMIKTDGRTLCNRSSPQECAICFPETAPGEFLLRELFIKAHFAKVDAFVSPSRFLKQRYVDWGLPEEKIVVIPNGVSIAPPPPPRALMEGEGRGVFAFFGQITPFKGVLELLRAFELIAQAPAGASAGVRLIINGANLEAQRSDFVEQFTKAIARVGARVLFAGPYKPSDLSQLMAGIDWVVVPSVWWENAPMVIEEALAHKRPVICSNIGGMAEKVTPGRDGLHFQVGNPFDLAQTLLTASRATDAWNSMRAHMRNPLSLTDAREEHLELYQRAPPLPASAPPRPELSL